MDALAAVWAGWIAAAQRTGAEWSALRLADLRFSQASAATLLLIALALVSLTAWALRAFPWRGASQGSARSQADGGRRLALPALLANVRGSRLAFVRHTPLVLALLGLPCLALALADPHSAFTREDTSAPGRRISLMIDASSSMLSALPSRQLAPGAPSDAAFFTTVGAARHFVELRRQGQYRDLLALIEFGDDAYVITPFTHDYDNILLSMALIGEWQEFMAFPDQGTTIARAIDQGVGLFQAFDFLEASGNAMVLFTDGADAEVLADGRSAFDVLAEARRAEIPVYFIKTGAGSPAPGVSDEAWRAAVARTGGQFYAAADEATLLRAIRDIDRASSGRIESRVYSLHVPRFAPFAALAVALWTLAATLRLTMPWFQTFP